jgi:hypothetical protein
METVCITALCVAGVSLVLSAVAYWRAGGRSDVEALRAELARRIRNGYEDSLARIRRAEQRLAALQESLSAEARQAVDELRAQLAETRQEIEAGLHNLKTGVSTRAEAAQEALHKRVLRLEGRAQLLMARADILRAERLAEKGELLHANELLEEAADKVREVKLRYGEAFEGDPIFIEMFLALRAAIRSVHEEAADHQQQIERALSASDALLASLTEREPPHTTH